jgi:pyruvate dehydrogenase E2 component (dihydrolipoamide acetyltransferase)
MALQIVVPKLGLTTDNVNIVEWKAKEGEWVEKGTVVVVIETQKTEWQVEAEASGFLHILQAEGANLPIGAVMGILAETKDEWERVKSERAAAPSARPSEPETASVATPGAAAGADETRIVMTPVARKMAEELMLDVARIKGTGPGGRITREDVLKASEEQKAGPAPSADKAPTVIQGKAVRESIPMKGMRKAIADHMVRSLATSAQLSFLGEADMSEMVKLREAFKQHDNAAVQKITYTETLVYVLAKALGQHPGINCSIIDNELKIWDDINIGVAVALGSEGLVVPVVRHADKMSLVQISDTIKALVEKARTGKLMPDDMSGGTFTITAVGSIGVSVFFTPVINQPECAIMGTSPIADRPIVREGQIVIAPIMTYSLTVDHRAINGFGAEQFMRTFQNLLKTPGLLAL